MPHTCDGCDEKLGEVSFLFCPECKEERIFVWSAWSGMEFYGYPPEQEYGWKCSICGSTFPEVSA
ncbi:MAG: hypothetical protein PHH91_12025 [Desulfuromonadaceae bacterium]|nr:hypothetical protein [Desulfuromonadaceae bacterium]